MKEININIEGYNVNGVCIGCLNYDRRMYHSKEARDCFKLLADVEVPDGLTMQICSFCLAEVRNVMRFRYQIVKSYDILIQYSKKYTFLNSPSDLSQYSTNRLTLVPTSEYSVTNDHETKSELDISFIKEEIDVKEKEEHCDNLMELEMTFGNDAFEETLENGALEDSFGNTFEDIKFSDNEVDKENQSSDDDILLSKLSRKKEKRKGRLKKKKKRSQSLVDQPAEMNPFQIRIARRLKNLPEHVVEVFTMDEEEMWRIRTQDIENKEFVKTKYKCDNCLIEFNSEKLLTYHTNGKHNPKGEDCIQCDVCKVYMLTKDKLSEHRALHTLAFRCLHCDYKTTVKRIISKHAQIHAIDEAGFKCNICGSAFSTKSKLTYHKSTCRQERPQCDCCGKVFASKMTLRHHLNLRNPKEEKPKEKLFIPCKGCDKFFTSKKSYRAHVVIHDGQTYPCSVCGKLFQWKRNLARHMRNHREREAGALHECKECNKTFASRDCYNNHMRFSKRHVSEEAYMHTCGYCGKKFATKWCLVDHVDWDHRSKIKYQCTVCLKAFKTAKIMVAHVNNIHEGKKNKEPEGQHLCEICGKSYKTVKRLKGHVWAMHKNRSTTKSFACKLCPATFTWQTSIYKHVKMMHEKKNKTPRSAVSKKLEKPSFVQDVFPQISVDRIPYFQQNVTNSLVPGVVQPPSTELIQNMV